MAVYSLAFAGLLLNTMGSLAQAATVIGKVVKLEGTVYAQDDAAARRDLKMGSDVFEKDTVFTESKSTVTLLFTDKSRFELGPEASLFAGN